MHVAADKKKKKNQDYYYTTIFIATAARVAEMFKNLVFGSGLLKVHR